MNDYQPGQRIRLVHTRDPHTDLQPGDSGTVRRHDPTLAIVYVDWDAGSRLSMLLDDGDEIAPVTEPDTAPAPAQSAQSAQQSRDAALAAARPAGSAAGRDAADWWAQHTVGGRASGDVRAAARRILAGIEDGDPAILDRLPRFDRSDESLDLSHLLTDDALEPPTADEHVAMLAAYADAYDEAAETRVVELCHLAASPTGTDLTHLHPDGVDIGSFGVFSGEWALTYADDGDRYSVAFVGVLVGRWNGWAVFACTRAVVDAIIADHDVHRRAHRDSLRASGVPEADLDARVDADMARLYFDGDVLVADLRAVDHDPESIDRVHPDRDGRYTALGRIWCWEAVDPYKCDQIFGTVPEPGDERAYVGLRHTPGLRLPDDRLRLTGLQPHQGVDGIRWTATLLLSGLWAATVVQDPNTETLHVSEYSPYAGFGREGMRAYVNRCRLDGAPVTEQRVLTALADECSLDAAIAQATAQGGTQVRLVDATGHTRALRPLIPAPRAYDQLLRCARALVDDTWPAPADRSWQVWTGTRWTTLPDHL